MTWESESSVLSFFAGQTARLAREKPVAVLGFGVSNRPLVHILLSMGAAVEVYDRKSPTELGEEALALQKEGVTFFDSLGAMELTDKALIFRTPGMRPDLPEIQAAVEAGAVLTSEMEWFFEQTPAHVLGITGSDGKTTTTTLVSLMLTAQYGSEHVFLGGNIGEPLLPHLPAMRKTDFAVVELSSFQLFTMTRSPERAALTNLSPNHLNWHRDMDEYIGAKTHIFRGNGCNLLVTNADNALTAPLARTLHPGQRVVLFSSQITDPARLTAVCPGADCILVRDGWITYFPDGQAGVPLIPVAEICLPGWYNRENIMTAAALCFGLVEPEKMREVVRVFRGVEHRLEYVRTVKGVRYYNGSIDSTPTRTAAALSALCGNPIVICGGYDKQIPFKPLAETLCKRAKAVVLTGATAEKINDALYACPLFDRNRLPIYRQPDFREAVLTAAAVARPGDTVLLSPACASFDSFPNFAVRGDTFKAIVRELTED